MTTPKHPPCLHSNLETSHDIAMVCIVRTIVSWWANMTYSSHHKPKRFQHHTPHPYILISSFSTSHGLLTLTIIYWLRSQLSSVSFVQHPHRGSKLSLIASFVPSQHVKGIKSLTYVWRLSQSSHRIWRLHVGHSCNIHCTALRVNYWNGFDRPWMSNDGNNVFGLLTLDAHHLLGPSRLRPWATLYIQYIADLIQVITALEFHVHQYDDDIQLSAIELVYLFYLSVILCYGSTIVYLKGCHGDRSASYR